MKELVFQLKDMVSEIASKGNTPHADASESSTTRGRAEAQQSLMCQRCLLSQAQQAQQAHQPHQPQSHQPQANEKGNEQGAFGVVRAGPPLQDHTPPYGLTCLHIDTCTVATYHAQNTLQYTRSMQHAVVQKLSQCSAFGNVIPAVLYWQVAVEARPRVNSVATELRTIAREGLISPWVGGGGIAFE